jgi:cytochrome c553
MKRWAMPRLLWVCSMITGCSDADPDAREEDAGTVDAGRVDAGRVDTGTADTGTADTGKSDAGASLEADGVRGGALYDSYWAVKRAPAPTADHPLWKSRPDATGNARTGPDTWRCKECHGWDYKGIDGAYGMGSHRTGITGVLGTQKTKAEIIALLADKNDHAYGDVLAPQDLADLAAFVKDWTIDTSSAITSAGAFSGDAVAGDPLFASVCANCHGADGLNDKPPGSDGGFEDFPGFISNDNPQEFLHKVRFGQPGTAMVPQAKLLKADELSDLGAYAQTLPEAP